jgi:DyP dimeric alpha+beta barrel domain
MPPFRTKEPVLPMSQIQGIVVPGFSKPHQKLVGVRFPHSQAAMRRVKAFLRSVPVSSAKVTLGDRRDYRRTRASGGTKAAAPASSPLQAVAFSYFGLSKLGVKADDIPSVAFKRGMAARSPLLGDPRTGHGSPATWKVGGPSSELDAIVRRRR